MAEHLAAIRGWRAGAGSDPRRWHDGRRCHHEREDDPVDSVRVDAGVLKKIKLRRTSKCAAK